MGSPQTLWKDLIYPENRVCIRQDELKQASESMSETGKEVQVKRGNEDPGF